MGNTLRRSLLLGIIVLSFGLFFVKDVISEGKQLRISRYSTYVKPNPVFVDETCTLTICIINELEEYVPCQLKVSTQNLELFPLGVQNVTARGGRGYYVPIPPFYIYENGETDVVFSLKSNLTGKSLAKVELWLEGTQVDFLTVEVDVISHNTEPPTPRQILFVPLELLLMPILAFLMTFTAFSMQYGKLLGSVSEVERKKAVKYGIYMSLLVVIIIGLYVDIQLFYYQIRWDWTVVPQVWRALSIFLAEENWAAVLFDITLAGLVLVLVGYLSFLGLCELVDKTIAWICGILIGVLSSLATYRFASVQNLYEVLFIQYGLFPILFLVILLVMITIGLSKRTRQSFMKTVE